MSGVIAPSDLDVIVGLGLDIAWKVTIPVAAGLAASALPGSAAARHLRLALGLAAAPALALATGITRGGDAAWMDAPAWPLVVWGVGAAVGLYGLLRGLRELAALRTTRDGAMERCAQIATPLTAGWWRPRILVPLDFDGWPAAARAAALAHERAHVRRADWAVHLGAWLLGAVFWFHPLVAVARRRLALLAECAADDAVLAEGHDPLAYAELLLRLGRSGPSAALSLGGSAIGARVRRVLGQHPRRAPTAGSLVLAAGALVLADGWVAPVAPWRAPPPLLTCAPEPVAPLFPVPADETVPYWSPTWSPVSSR